MSMAAMPIASLRRKLRHVSLYEWEGRCRKRGCVEPSSHTFTNLLGQLFAQRSEQVREALSQKAAARRVGPSKLQDLRKVVGYLQKRVFDG
jgi:hypothetical protein